MMLRRYSLFILFIISISFTNTSANAGVNYTTIRFVIHQQNDSERDITGLQGHTGIFEKKSEIVVIIHGWTETPSKPWIKKITQAYLNRKEKTYQVIVVDWRYEAESWYYYVSEIVSDIGIAVGDWLIRLADLNGFDANRYHIIGHSLGCHVVSFAGKHAKKKLGRPLPRITYLDASGPAFNFVSPKKRVSKDDAEVVVSIHTDEGWMGLGLPYGGIDFYVNGGGHNQPGCVKSIEDELVIEKCSHHRSRTLWIEAIQGYYFYGTKCDSWENFKAGLCKNNPKLNFAGTNSITRAHLGSYYTNTNADEPFLKDPSINRTTGQ